MSCSASLLAAIKKNGCEIQCNLDVVTLNLANWVAIYAKDHFSIYYIKYLYLFFKAFQIKAFGPKKLQGFKSAIFCLRFLYKFLERLEGRTKMVQSGKITVCKVGLEIQWRCKEKPCCNSKAMCIHFTHNIKIRSAQPFFFFVKFTFFKMSFCGKWAWSLPDNVLPSDFPDPKSWVSVLHLSFVYVLAMVLSEYFSSLFQYWDPKHHK